MSNLLKEKNHKIQPIGFDDEGTIRFKKNEIVRFLLDQGPFDLNGLSMMMQNGQFTNDDYTQLMQLIGYSVDRYGELSSSPKKIVKKADKKMYKLMKIKDLAFRGAEEDIEDEV